MRSETSLVILLAAALAILALVTSPAQGFAQSEENATAALIDDARVAIEEANATLHSLAESVGEEALSSAFDLLGDSIEELEAAEEAFSALSNATGELRQIKLVEAKLRAEHARALAGAAKSLGEALAGKAKAEAEVSSLESRVEKLSSEKSGLESEVSELSAKVRSLEAGNWIYAGGGLLVGALIGLGLALAERRRSASVANRARRSGRKRPSTFTPAYPTSFYGAEGSQLTPLRSLQRI